MESRTLTSEQQKVLNQYCQYGTESFVNRQGRKWTVSLDVNASGRVYNTKREALDHAESAIYAYTH